MSLGHPLSPADPWAECPVPVALLGDLYRAEDAAELVVDLPPRTRARLAAFLYQRSHTRTLGLQVAAHCDEESLRVVAGTLGTVLHQLARRPHVEEKLGTVRSTVKTRITLAGPQRRHYA